MNIYEKFLKTLELDVRLYFYKKVDENDEQLDDVLDAMTEPAQKLFVLLFFILVACPIIYLSFHYLKTDTGFPWFKMLCIFFVGGATSMGLAESISKKLFPNAISKIEQQKRKSQIKDTSLFSTQDYLKKKENQFYILSQLDDIVATFSNSTAKTREINKQIIEQYKLLKNNFENSDIDASLENLVKLRDMVRYMYKDSSYQENNPNVVKSYEQEYQDYRQQNNILEKEVNGYQRLI